MTQYTIELQGDADADAVREAFEIAVRAIRGALDEAGGIEPFGTLVLGGIDYDAEDVADEAEGADSEDEDDEADEGDADAAEPGEISADQVVDDEAAGS